MDQQQRRTVFFVSDRTAISAETLGRGLLSQFDAVEFIQVALPFVDTEAKARAAVARIDEAAQSGERPLVFSTLVRTELREIVMGSRGLHLDFFEAFMAPLEAELRQPSSHSVGRLHGLLDTGRYDARIEAVNFALATDDGIGIRDYAAAEIILVGVSRSGKTPTCLYLAMQYGVHAANYPLTEENLENARLPVALEPYRARLAGLIISPERLQQIRQARRPDSPYAALRQCEYETRRLEVLLRQEHIRTLDSTHMSIEEIAASLVHELGLVRRR